VPEVSRYSEIAADLRRRIQAGEFPVGSTLPGIGDLMEYYDVAGLNTIRAAEQVLVKEGLLRTRHGVGTFVEAVEPLSATPDVLIELRVARDALTRAITALEKCN
jgi:DNA-binding GntR family transcriptional regulator